MNHLDKKTKLVKDLSAQIYTSDLVVCALAIFLVGSLVCNGMYSLRDETTSTLFKNVTRK